MSSQLSHDAILKMVSVGAITLVANYLILNKLFKHKKTPEEIKTQKQIASERQILYKAKNKIKKAEKKQKADKGDLWGVFRINREILKDDGLLYELKQMDQLLFEVERVNHLIIDLNLTDFKTIRSPIVIWESGEVNERAFMSEKTLVQPGEFIIQKCTFRPGLMLQLEKKFMRAGPRATQYFRPEDVRADIVCLGNICPGLNTILRELVLFLKNVYNVNKIFGVRQSFKGYYEDNIIELTPQMLQTVHRLGGCYLGLCKTQFHAQKIVDSLVQRGINQLYLIGANSTLAASQSIYEQIKKRKLNIALSVMLKGINRDVPIFDTCFGFESAAEQSAHIIQQAYYYSHSFTNGISFVKLPGVKSGFLAAQAVLSTINSNICLVPEIPFDLYGEKGLIQFIIYRMKLRGNCTIVFSEGVQSAIRDSCLLKSQNDQRDLFEKLLISELTKRLTAEKIKPFKIGIYNGVQQVQSTPTNSLDTKLCCQIAQASVYGLMSGYTNFAVGHLANKNAMIPINELLNAKSQTYLRQYDALWQRVLGATGQPSFLNNVQFSDY